MSRVNLAIIGGGLVGASLALALQAGAKAQGWKIVLIEPFAPGDSWQPSYDARSSALSFGSRQIYQRLGVWQEISRRAEPIKQIHVSDRGRFSTARLSAMEEGVPAFRWQFGWPPPQGRRPGLRCAIPRRVAAHAWIRSIPSARG